LTNAWPRLKGFPEVLVVVVGGVEVVVEGGGREVVEVLRVVDAAWPGMHWWYPGHMEMSMAMCEVS
jgi:hypothetical protein